jgi:hypothetical protein
VVNCAYGYQTKETSEDKKGDGEEENFQETSHKKEIFSQEKGDSKKSRDKSQGQRQKENSRPGQACPEKAELAEGQAG